MTAEEALNAFHQATGLKVVAVHDPDSNALWWAEDPDRPDVFTCSVGDRTLHVDELAPLTRARKP